MAHEKFIPSATIDEFAERIAKWYESNHLDFKAMFHATIEGLKKPPVDKSSDVYYDWEKHGTIDGLCNFFREWYAWEPKVEEGLNYIEKFSWLNYRNDDGMKFVTTGAGLLMTYDFTQLQGRYMDSPASRDLVGKWEEELGPKMEDYVVPQDGFQNFNEFFTRDLKPGVRPIDAPNDDSVVVAPADCVINMIVDDLTADTALPVKTVTMNVETLLDRSEYAASFVKDHKRGDTSGGTAVSCILMPDTYHWYHSPVTGRVVESRDDIGGIYYGMRDFPELLNKGDVGYGYDYSMFEHFRRGYLVIETEQHGYVGMVPVGLNSIASVRFLEKFRDVNDTTGSVAVNKGEKIGYFKYGGSLNILLFEPGRFPALRLLQGQRIGQLEMTLPGFFSTSGRAPSANLES
ncbi:phosphatidylserine decarboxylase [Saccharothrix xinjiangensis]|uniref:Phosphatidylserine decarboxylase n=1 Tax=Saccharothrix xinjiangensis TaxID=204798 RepID=A0ABV9Y0D8_9PSEU